MIRRLKKELWLAVALRQKTFSASWLRREVLRRSTMFIAWVHKSSALQRSAMCLGPSSYVPLLTERVNQRCRGYKHPAPPEQKPRPQLRATFCARLFAGFVVLSTLTGCNARLPGQPTEADRWRAPADVSDFSELYTQNCAGCHGNEGRLGAARPLNDPLYLSFVPDDALKQVISQGRPGTNMPAFSQQAGGALTDRQIALLISGMRASWSKPEAFKGVEIPAYSASETVTEKASAGSIVNASAPGDAPSGARAYQTYCQRCHGPAGGGGAGGAGGPAGSIVDPNFLNLVSDQGLRTTVVVGRSDLSKPDWRSNVAGHPMSPPEIDAVVAWLASQRQTSSATAERIKP
jgi:cytochrome c oxidase cbb3-type subunit 3